MRAAAIPAGVPAASFRSKRLLAFARDEKLVEQIRRGNEAAFEVAFERYGAGILGFCRHMLGSREEAEDAVQHTFAAAFRDLQRDGERPLALKPWLYSIARNRCVSMLRARREQPAEQADLPTAGLAEQVERRAELRDLLRDLRELPEDQRAALLLSEAGGLSHAEIAGVLGCEGAKVKALVFRARSALIQRRAARETPCEEIRESLANLRGGALRRGELRHHLRECVGCRAYREQVRQQRRMLAAALPIVPSVGLKSSVMAALGLGGGSAGGGLAAGLGAAGSASVGSSALAKVALVGVLAGGGAVAGKTAVEGPAPQPEPRPPVAAPASEPPVAGAVPGEPAGPRPVSGSPGAERGDRAGNFLAGTEPRAHGRARDQEGPRGPRAAAPGLTRPETAPPGAQPGEVAPQGGHGNGLAKGHATPQPGPDLEHGGNGRGPIDAPPAETPVQRGPPNPKPARPEKGPEKVKVGDEPKVKAKAKAESPPPAALVPPPAAPDPPKARPEKAPKAPNGRGHAAG
jgi:RNA polymerase sigma factor (sigma-70 family)